MQTVQRVFSVVFLFLLLNNFSFPQQAPNTNNLSSLFSLFDLPYTEAVKDKTILKQNVDATPEIQQNYFVSVKDNWFGYKDITTDYILNNLKNVLQIEADFTGIVSFNELAQKITLELASPLYIGNSLKEAPSKKMANWATAALSVSLHDFGDKLRLYIYANKFWGYSNYKLSDKTYSIQEALMDLDGDKKKEFVTLLGKRVDGNGLYFEDIKLLIEVDKNKMGLIIPLPKEINSGFMPKFSLIDFTGDKTPELLIELPTGGSGGIINCVVYTLKNSKAKVIFDSGQNYLAEIEGYYQKGFKAEIRIKNSKISQTFDLSNSKEDLIQLGAFNKYGEVQKTNDIWLNSFGQLKAIDIDKDGTLELQTVQAIKASANYFTVGYIMSYWKWKKDRFVLTKSLVKQNLN